MRLTALIPTIVAAAVLAGPAGAQSGPEVEEPSTENGEPVVPLPGPDIDTATDLPDDLPGPEDDAARAAHLDELFRRLAGAEDDGWQRIQAQIIRAWNHSGSDSMDLLARRADRAIEKKDYDAALLHLDDLVRLAPEFAEGWNKRATVHFIREDYGPSLEDIARTLQLEPRHFGALSGLGLILDRIGDSEGALEAYRRALAIHPNLPGIGDGIQKLQREVDGERL